MLIIPTDIKTAEPDPKRVRLRCLNKIKKVMVNVIAPLYVTVMFDGNSLNLYDRLCGLEYL